MSDQKTLQASLCDRFGTERSAVFAGFIPFAVDKLAHRPMPAGIAEPLLLGASGVAGFVGAAKVSRSLEGMLARQDIRPQTAGRIISATQAVIYTTAVGLGLLFGQAADRVIHRAIQHHHTKDAKMGPRLTPPAAKTP